MACNILTHPAVWVSSKADSRNWAMMINQQSVNLHSLTESYKHHFKDAKHGHIWPLVIYDHVVTPIRPSSIRLFPKILC